MEPCTYCNGSGRCPGYEMMWCPKCGGKGSKQAQDKTTWENQRRDALMTQLNKQLEAESKELFGDYVYYSSN